MSVSLVFFALAMGALIAVYFPMIAQSAQILGSKSLANVPFFFIATIASIVIAIANGHRWADFVRTATLPPLLLFAGVMSAGLIIGSSFLIPRIGIGAYMVLLVSGQVLAGLAFGYFGLFGAAPTAITFGKIAGVVFVILGVWLVTYK